MVAFAGLLALAAVSGPPSARALGEQLRLAVPGDGGAPAALVVARGSARGAERGVPAWSGEVCQPVVAVPGYERGYSTRGKRTELTLRLLEKARLEPFATAAYWLAASGIRLDYTPPQASPGSYPPGYAGWGRASIEIRWRIDAFCAPVFPRRTR